MIQVGLPFDVARSTFHCTLVHQSKFDEVRCIVPFPQDEVIHLKLSNLYVHLHAVPKKE